MFATIETGFLQKSSTLTIPFRRAPAFPNSEAFLKFVTRDGYPDASASTNYAYAKFGRDGEKYAFDSLKFHPERALPVIVGLAESQGVALNPITEEEPGKIVHEQRKYSKNLPQASKEIFHKLNPIWGDGKDSLSYYGSADATPLFISLVAAYCNRVGNTDILHQKVHRKNGQECTIGQSVEAAAVWLEDRIQNGPRLNEMQRAEPCPQKRLPLLEFRKMNGKGLTNQNWKDSGTSLIHENGTLVNHTYPIASIDLQGYAYDGLMDAADLLQDQNRETAEKRRALAWSVRETTINEFWIPEKNYFAVALDRGKEGNYRKVTTTESNPAEILTTRFFDELSDGEKEKYVGAIVKKIYNKDFLTDVGIRCRSLKHTSLVDFIDYHGPFAVWTKNTSEIAKGLAKQGFLKLAKQLQVRILNSVRVAGSFQELFYVSADGSVLYNPQRRKKILPQQSLIAPAFPEENQTWTGSAVNEIEEELQNEIVENKEKKPWQEALEQRLLHENSQVTLVTSPREALRRRLLIPRLSIDFAAGQKAEDRFKLERQQTA